MRLIPQAKANRCLPGGAGGRANGRAGPGDMARESPFFKNKEKLLEKLLLRGKPVVYFFSGQRVSCDLRQGAVG